MAFEPVSFLAGSVIGYAVRGDGKVQAITKNGALQELMSKKPVVYEILPLDASVAREKREYQIAADYIRIKDYHASVPFYIRLNEPDFAPLDLATLRGVRGLIHRFFITNMAGSGNVVLEICRGIEIEEADPVSLAELAARLGSIVTYDRRGEVVWLDDFEDNINKWNSSFGAAGGSLALSTDESRSGSNSAKLICPTGGYAIMNRTLPYTPSPKLGFEAHECFPTAGNITRVLDLGVLTTTKQFEFEIRYDWTDAVTGTWKIYTYPTTWVTLSGIPSIEAIAGLFHAIKVVVDLENGKYVRLLVDGIAYDISQYTPNWGVNTNPPRITPTIYHAARAGQQDTIYVDDVIITRNEP